MLKLTLKPGDYIDVGENIRVVFSGGSAFYLWFFFSFNRFYNWS